MSYKLAGVEWNDDGTMKNKQLSPLEAWEEVKYIMSEWTEGYEENFDIIEKELKEYEDIKSKCFLVAVPRITNKTSPIEELLELQKVIDIIKKNANVKQLLMAIEMNGVLGSELKLLKEVLL